MAAEKNNNSNRMIGTRLFQLVLVLSSRVLPAEIRLEEKHDIGLDKHPRERFLKSVLDQNEQLAIQMVGKPNAPGKSVVSGFVQLRAG